jgi:trans-aconitate 2-methyltransferase
MLARSAAFAGDGLRFERGEIETWAPPSGAPLDLVFSNAALHWVDDHPALLARLTAMLAPGGQIAVQVPANDDHPSHAVAREVAAESPFREALAGYVRVAPNLTPEAYATLLDRLGFEEIDARAQVYGHRLASADGVVEWVKGTLLTDYARRMPEELFARFVARYREVLVPRLEEGTAGGSRPYFFTFKRILFRGAGLQA